MADELNGCFMMSTPKAIRSLTGRQSLPEKPPEWFENTHSLSSPVKHQKSSVFSVNSEIHRTLLEGKMAFGSPSYPSPLDRVRTKRKQHGLHMGESGRIEESFELNQSYPKVSKSKIKPQEMSAPKITLGDGLNGFSFSPGRCTGSFSTSLDSLSESWSFYNYIGGGQTALTFPTTVRNPNKAICTINAKTSEILVANDMACELFGYDQTELVGMKLKNVIKLKPREEKTLAESHLEPTGEIVLLSGIVVEAVDVNDIVLPVSLWVKKLDYHAEPRCLCVMEPVDRSVGTVVFDKHGSVLSCDQKMACLHGYESPADICGLSLKQLLPTFKQPNAATITKEVRKQQVTGKTRTGAVFPLSIQVSLARELKDFSSVPSDTESIIKSHYPEDVFIGVVWVFANISGMITFLPNGTIHNINENFSQMLFGFSKNELIGKDISTLIPDFYEILDLDDDIPLPPIEDNNQDHLRTKKENDEVLETDHCRVLKELRELSLDSPEVTSTPRSGVSNSEGSEEKKHPHPEHSTGKENSSSNMLHNKSVPSDCTHDKNSSVCLRTNNCCSVENLCAGVLCQDVLVGNSSVKMSGKLEDSFSEQSDLENSNPDNASSSQDGMNADISSESSGDGKMSPLSTAVSKKKKQKMDMSRQVREKNCVNDLESSSVSCNAEKAARLLIAFSNNNNNDSSNITNSTGGCHTEEESSYFSHDNDSSINCSPVQTSSFHTDNSDHSCFSSDSACINNGHSMDGSRSANPCDNRALQGNFCDNLNRSYKSSDNFSGTENLCEDLLGNPISSIRIPVSVNASDYIDNPCDMDPDCANPERMDLRQYGTQTSHIQTTQKFPAGSFSGFCNHKDGHVLPIIFQVKPVELEDGSIMYCMWVSRDPEEPREGGQPFANLTLASSLNSTQDKSNISLGEMLAEKANSESKLDEPEEVKEVVSDTGPMNGLYDRNYTTLDSIGKGAFGFVKLAKQKSDDKEVVVKFIRRGKVLSQYWVEDEEYGRIPLEVRLLLTLNHPNIVKVLDVYQDDDFVHMVMEKHGSGMDLFEFIDRGPLMDEPLCSYIFRQMVSAVSYLHSNNIVHRDIKDENIIISENFQIKLIDFGAAAFLKPDKLFGTFCGTIEYCSPEVLLGNKYKGPELEVWSMGITLYTLVFGETPFFDIEETTKGILNPPFNVSRSLMFLISWLLHPDPVCRATVDDVEHNAWVNQHVDVSQYKWSEVLPNCEFHGNTGSDNRKDSTDGIFDFLTSKTDKLSPLNAVELHTEFKNCPLLDNSSDYY